MKKQFLVVLIAMIMLITVFATGCPTTAMSMPNNDARLTEKGSIPTYLSISMTQSPPWDISGYLRIQDQYGRAIGGKTVDIHIPGDYGDEVYHVTTRDDGSYSYHIGYDLPSGFTGVHAYFKADGTFADSDAKLKCNIRTFLTVSLTGGPPCGISQVVSKSKTVMVKELAGKKLISILCMVMEKTPVIK